MTDLAGDIEAARKKLRDMKRTTPWVFDEYRTLQALRQRHAVLTEMLEKAERKWKELGK